MKVAEDPSKALGIKAKGGNFQYYVQRFSYDHWRDLMAVFMERSGPALAGSMMEFNTMESNVSKSIKVRKRTRANCVLAACTEARHWRIWTSSSNGQLEGKSHNHQQSLPQ